MEQFMICAGTRCWLKWDSTEDHEKDAAAQNRHYADNFWPRMGCICQNFLPAMECRNMASNNGGQKRCSETAKIWFLMGRIAEVLVANGTHIAQQKTEQQTPLRPLE